MEEGQPKLALLVAEGAYAIINVPKDLLGKEVYCKEMFDLLCKGYEGMALGPDEGFDVQFPPAVPASSHHNGVRRGEYIKNATIKEHLTAGGFYVVKPNPQAIHYLQLQEQTTKDAAALKVAKNVIEMQKKQLQSKKSAPPQEGEKDITSLSVEELRNYFVSEMSRAREDRQKAEEDRQKAEEDRQVFRTALEEFKAALEKAEKDRQGLDAQLQKSLVQIQQHLSTLDRLNIRKLLEKARKQLLEAFIQAKGQEYPEINATRELLRSREGPIQSWIENHLEPFGLTVLHLLNSNAISAGNVAAHYAKPVELWETVCRHPQQKEFKKIFRFVYPHVDLPDSF
ncbi:hypothetical protein QOT17_002096 [Balamuthia mandrillaris]